jgi:hypothetical protein
MGQKKFSSQFMAHCRRELLHEQWKILLDEDFLHAYQYGLVVECDGATCRFFPRIFTYSADYQEKYVCSEYLALQLIMLC